MNAAEIWPRWSAVTQIGGKFVPEQGVALEWWAPWSTFLASQQRARSTDRPYLEFAALGRALGDHSRQATWRDLSVMWLRRFGPVGEAPPSTTAGEAPEPSMQPADGAPQEQSIERLGFAAAAFERCVDLLANRQDDKRETGRQRLEAYFRDAAPCLTWQPAKGQWQREWSASTLLTVFALMLYEDLAAGRHVGRCPACDRFFVAKGQDPTYCSMRCRRRVQQQRYRAQRRDDVDGA
jgi:Family of unknown function (DUF6076)